MVVDRVWSRISESCHHTIRLYSVKGCLTTLVIAEILSISNKQTTRTYWSLRTRICWWIEWMCAMNLMTIRGICVCVLDYMVSRRVKTYRITSFVSIVVAFGAWPQALEIFLGSNYTFHGVMQRSRQGRGAGERARYLWFVSLFLSAIWWLVDRLHLTRLRYMQNDYDWRSNWWQKCHS